MGLADHELNIRKKAPRTWRHAVKLSLGGVSSTTSSDSSPGKFSSGYFSGSLLKLEFDMMFGSDIEISLSSASVLFAGAISFNPWGLRLYPSDRPLDYIHTIIYTLEIQILIHDFQNGDLIYLIMSHSPGVACLRGSSKSLSGFVHLNKSIGGKKCVLIQILSL